MIGSPILPVAPGPDTPGRAGAGPEERVARGRANRRVPSDTSRRDRPHAQRAVAPARPERRPLLSAPAATALALALIAACLVALHGAVLGFPFLEDDYIFLDQAQRGLFGSLSFAFLKVPTYFRPLSREAWFYFGTLVADHDARAFHLANFGLLLATVGLIVALGRRLAGLRTGLLAGGLFALFHPHRVQLGYVSCVQDLLACALATGAMLLHARGRRWHAAAAFFAALLAKESVVPLPLIVAAWEAWPPRGRRAPPLGERLRSTGPWWIAACAWALLVPGLRSVLAAPGAGGGMLPTSGIPVGAAAAVDGYRLALLSLVAAEQPWRDLAAGIAKLVTFLPWVGVALAALAAAAAFTTDDAPAPAPRPGAARLGLLWRALGALPVAVVGARFSAYYAGFPAIGFALVVAAGLARLPAPAAAAVFAVLATANLSANGTERIRLDEDDRSVPRGISITSPQRLRREARYVRAFRAALMEQPPPRGAVIWLLQPFGFQLMGTAGGRAARVWFDDPTLDTEVLQPTSADLPQRPSVCLRFDPAHATFTRLPGDFAVEMARAEAAVAVNDTARAARAYARALALLPPGAYDSERVTALYNSGVLAGEMGDTAAARARFEDVLAIAPGSPDAMLGLSGLFLDAGRFDEARSWIDRVLAVAPDHPVALLRLVVIERDSGDWPAAQRALDRLTEAHPAFVDSVMRSAGLRGPG